MYVLNGLNTSLLIDNQVHRYRNARNYVGKIVMQYYVYPDLKLFLCCLHFIFKVIFLKKLLRGSYISFFSNISMKGTAKCLLKIIIGIQCGKVNF